MGDGAAIEPARKRVDAANGTKDVLFFQLQLAHLNQVLRDLRNTLFAFMHRKIRPVLQLLVDLRATAGLMTLIARGLQRIMYGLVLLALVLVLRGVVETVGD